ncbi:hypothetical protein SAMN02745823_01863 [Sporobacter termitidis DSM 10068]|uniref:Uncharacterized protein n=1 Tax=Sporobacter termitidis DSM 10068 TaxID=1123282 RepID=A0A1M5XJ21_9FIRM|nr:DUF6514 family protein [Sporobacter termitidis]SHH99837.1 hypothetical protein SAMN02745823_01863 [Sporobacter termitidis DSM 10068]
MPIETLVNENTTILSIASYCKDPECEDHYVYGIMISYGDQTIFEQQDISTNEIDVIRLISLIKGHDISLDQLPYIVEDYVTSLYIS